MQFARGIQHILAGSLAIMLAIGLSAAYWAIAGPGSILQRADNPRRIQALAAIQRGRIVDRQQRLLAETVAGAATLERRYILPAASSAVGYYSLRYGVSGAEAAYDDLLSGRRQAMTLRDYIERQLLRLPQVGADIQLTIDADLQNSLAAALADARGAAVVIHASTGEIAALLSQPSVNANRLDEDWEALVADAGQPFFNRALQGNYQLGGTMYTVLLAQAIASQFDLSQVFPQATVSVELEDSLTISCVSVPEAAELTLVEAYVYGCPRPFLAYFLSAPQIDRDAALRRFAFGDPISLAGFPQAEAIALSATGTAEPLDDEARERHTALGQGDLSTTPLHMASIMAAVATDGSVKMPSIHAATKPPGAQRWQERSAPAVSSSIMSADEAQGLRAIMRRAWSQWQIDTDGDAGMQIAKSQAGDEAQLWLTGYFASADDAAFSFAIVLEDSGDLSKLRAIGQHLIESLSRR